MVAASELAGPMVATILARQSRGMAQPSLGATPPGEPVTRMARKSLTLVRVGPVTIWSPRASNRPWPSLSARRARGSMPSARARARVSGLTIAPAAGPAPSMPSVSPASAQTCGKPVQRDGEAEQELDVAPAAPPAAHRHRGLAAREQHAGRRQRVAGSDDRPRDAGHDLADFGRLALQRVAEDQRGHPRLPRHGGGGLQRQLRRGDHDGLDAGKPRIAGLRRLVAGSGQMGAHRGRRLDAVAGEDRRGLGEGRRIGDGRSGGDRRRIVAGNVGNDQADHSGRMRRGRQAPALDRREMAADGVHLGDVGAAPEQRGVDRLLVGERNALGRQRQQRRAAARDQAEHEVVRTGGPRDLEHAGGSGAPGLVGDRMRGLDDLDPLAGHGMAVAGDDEAGQRPRPVILDRLRHGGRGLAGAEDDGASFRRRREVAGDDAGRKGCRNRGIEHAAQ